MEHISRFDDLRQVLARLQLDAERARSDEESQHCRRLASVVMAVMRDEQRRVAPRIVFREAGADLWELGVEGETHTARADSPIGARAAHLALSGRTPALRTLTAAKHADRVLRAARGITAAWAERHDGCRELATAIRALEIRAGHVWHVPRAGAPTFVLG